MANALDDILNRGAAPKNKLDDILGRSPVKGNALDAILSRGVQKPEKKIQVQIGGKPVSTEELRAQRAAWAKARWCGIVGAKTEIQHRQGSATKR